MVDSGSRLGIDFGTSNTVAVLRWPDGRPKALLFDGAPLLPSAVYVAEDGSIMSGRDAVHSARLHPHRFEPYPKRRIDETTVYLGDREIPSTELIAAVLRRVAAEAQRVAGAPPAAVTITHPAAWGRQRRDALSRAAASAGLPSPMLVAEPVAAASYFVATVGTHLPIGGPAVVYDFGAGTFDATVVRRTAAGGFDVLSTEGLTDAGGLDVDAAIVTYLGQQLGGRDPGKWSRLSQPAVDADRRAAWQLWEDARHAKETLSRAATTYIHVPLFDDSVPLGREQLERLARPILDRTVTAALLAVSSAGLAPSQLSAVFLVGGSSRIPLAATLLHRGFGAAPTAIEQPELVVAEGALQLTPRAGRATVAPAAATAALSGRLGPVSGSPVSGSPVSGSPVSGSPVSGSPVSGSPVSGSPVPVQPVPGSHPHPHIPEQRQPATWALVGHSQGSVAGPPAMTSPQVRAPQPSVRPAQPTGTSAAAPGMFTSHPRPPYAPPYPGAPWHPLPTGRPGRSRWPFVGGLVAGLVVLALVIAGVVYALNGPGESPGSGGQPTVAAACGYKIAYLGVLSGADSSDGLTVRNSTRMAVDRYVREHANCPTELVEYDTKGDAAEATRLADQVAKDPTILGIVGPVWLDESQQVMPILDAAGITVITPTLSSSHLAKRGWKTFHRMVGNDLDQAAAGVRYLRTVLSAQRVFIVADSDEIGSAVASDVRLKLDTAAVGRADIAGNEIDYSTVINQITGTSADAVYFAGYHDAGATFVKQLRTARPGIKVVAWDRAFTGAFVRNAGPEADGVVITCPCIPPDEARSNFASNYKERFSDPGYYAPEAYDAANVLLAALAAGKSTRADVLAYVGAYEGDGVSRRIKFTPDGDLVNGAPSIWAYQVRGGGVYKDRVVASD